MLHRSSLYRFCLPFLLLLLTLAAAQAQNVSLKGDVIMVDKKPYAKLLKSGGMLLKDYTLSTLDDKEVMLAKGTIIQLPNNETFIYYVCTFKAGGETAEMNKEGLNYAQQLATALVKNDVMRDGQPNPEGIARFVQAYSTKISAKYAKQKEEQLNMKPLEYPIVTRSYSNGGPQIAFKRATRLDILQGGTVIGNLNNLGTDKGIAHWTVTLPGGGLVIANLDIEVWTADSPGARDMGYKMLVRKNNQYHHSTAVGGVEAVQQSAISYLVGGGYL